jgi:hypothetical protein
MRLLRPAAIFTGYGKPAEKLKPKVYRMVFGLSALKRWMKRREVKAAKESAADRLVDRRKPARDGPTTHSRRSACQQLVSLQKQDELNISKTGV